MRKRIIKCISILLAITIGFGTIHQSNIVAQSANGELSLEETNQINGVQVENFDTEINMFSMDTRTVGNDITSEIDVVNLKAWIAGNLVYEKGKGSTFPDTIYGGSSFKFALNWKAKDSTKRFSSGDTFHINIGTITGLNMSEAKTSNLYINGIKVAESKLTYISNVLTYTVTFNESIKYFENLQGNFTSNTTFINVDSDKKIEIEFETNSKGEITIIKKPVLPGTGGDTGVGLPPVAPIYKELVAIGKSTFFVDYNNPFLGWRILFTDLLHKNQENINTPANTEYTEDLIIEDILDENQEFADEAEIGFGVPFYLDIPMMLPGTQSAVAYTSSVEGRNVNPVLPEGNGNSYYIIKPTADKFVKLNSEEAVRNKPFSWAIVNVSNRQKLVVNLGKLGTKDIAKGITTDFITNRISTTPTIDKLDEVIAGEIKKYEDAIIKCGESGTSCSAEYKQNVADTIEALKRAKTYYGLQENRIYGFNLKYKTKVVNTSTGKVSNEAKITTGKLEYDVDSEVNHSYDSGISGVFSKGDIVLMKADQTYGYTESDLSSSKNLVGMKDIKFEAYDVDTNKKLYFFNPSLSERGEYQFYGTSASGNDFTSELVTDVDGKIVISGLLPAHNYYLKEVSTPDGYYHGDKEKIPFTVDSTKVNYKIIENVSRSVTLKKMDKKDNKTLENVEFALFDSNNQRLNGFKIDEIKGKKYYTYTNQVTNTGSLLTLADGTLTIRNLPAGKYYLKEVMALPGYILSDEKHEFELKEDYTNDITTIDLGDIYNLSQKASIRMQKVDDKDTSIPLENAYFQLYKRNTGSSWSSGNHDEWSLIDATQFNKSGTFITANKMEKDALITNDNGDISISSLPEGDYYLKEVKAPNGYLLSDKHYHFTIDSSTTESKLNASRTLNEDVMEEVAQNQVVNQKGKASIKLIKYDRALGASVKVDGIEKTLDQIFYENADTQIKVKKPLKGVVFDLYRKDKETIDIQSDTKIATDLISDKYGEILVDKLEIGTYYFVETKTLDDYQLKRDPIVVEVTQADIQKDSATLVKLVDNYLIEYQIDLIKKDKETNALLQGAHFEMYTSNDEVMKFTYDETKNMYIPNEQGTSTLVTNNEGKISIGNVVSKQTFYFKEIKSPDGYKIDEDNNRHTVTIMSADVTYTKEEPIITEIICTNEKMKDGHEQIQPENPDVPQKPQDPQNRPATMDMKNYYFETLLISGILLCVFYMKRKKYAKS